MSISLDRFGREAFFRFVKRAADRLSRWAKEGNPISIVSHVDADGISAAGIMASCLYRLGVPFRVRIVPWLDEDIISELSSDFEGPFVFTDIGSSYMELLAKELGTRGVLVLDHHPPSGPPPPGWVEVNPHNHGLDGSKDISGAGVAYLVARELDSSFRDLAPLAVVGALGDLQDTFNKRSLAGLNELAVRDAVEAGLLEVSKDLIFYGRETRPIHKAMAYTTSPLVPGITYREDNCLMVLSKAGIRVKEDDRWRAVRDLTDEEKERLLEALRDFLASRGHPPSIVDRLV
ncbi:MAG TPA: DHH family phosphoesterase, partial [Candidatus Bathyarchaeota archaeon]|nr:DHH family phosphoesterase [Candidatus Bathyarchaeota archaeon]